MRTIPRSLPAVILLLAAVERSGLEFIRNGSRHTAAEAADHIRDKYEHYRKEIRTVEDFIAEAATKSLLSGKPYLVVLPDAGQRPLAEWLRERWDEARARRDAPGR